MSSLVSIGIRIDKTGIGVFENMGDQAISFFLFFLVILVEFFIVVQENLFVK